MKIYWFKAQAPRRVLALAKHLGVDAECIELDLMAGALKTPSYLAFNPNGKAPTLVDGDFVLWESSAIMTYLCIKAGSDMWPADRPDEQVQVLRWLSWNDSHWSRAVLRRFWTSIWRGATSWPAAGSPSRTFNWHRWPAIGVRQRCR
jgi:glutathione S-transferase